MLNRRRQIADQDQLRARGQIVKQRGGFVKKQRQIVLNPRGQNAGAHVFIIVERLGSPSKVSRQRLRNAARALSSKGNSRPGSKRTSRTGCRLRCASGSNTRMESMRSSNKSTRYGSAAPIGNRSINEPRIAYSPGRAT